MDKNNLTELARDVYRLTLLFPTREPLRYKLREIADDIVAEFIMERNDYLNNIRRLLEVAYSYFDIAVVQNWVSPSLVNQTRDNYALAAQKITEIKLAQEIATAAAVKETQAPPSERTARDADFILIPDQPSANMMASSAQHLMASPAETPVIAAVAEDTEKSEPAESVKTPLSMAAANDIDNDETIENELTGKEQGGNGLSDGQVARQNRIVEFLKQHGSAQVWEIQKIFPSVSKRTIRRDFRSMLKQGLIERTGERNTTAYKFKIELS